MTVTDQLLDFVRTAAPDAEATARARTELARFRAAANWGSQLPVVAALRQTLGSAEPPGSASTAGSTEPPGSAEPTAAGSAEPSPWRSWINGTAACAAGQTGDNGTEWVAVCAAADAFSGTSGTPSADAFSGTSGTPAADVFSGADEDSVAEAVAIGYAVAAGTAAALGSAHTDAGWSVSSTAGSVGAAASVGRLLGLDPAGLRAMFGICATQAAGIVAAAGTAAEAVQVGKAASNAVEAGLLAGNGFTSSARPLEGRRGMFALMSTSPDETELVTRLSPAASQASASPRRRAGTQVAR